MVSLIQSDEYFHTHVLVKIITTACIVHTLKIGPRNSWIVYIKFTYKIFICTLKQLPRGHFPCCPGTYMLKSCITNKLNLYF